MKKFFSLFLTILLLTCTLISCKQSDEFTNPWEDPSLSERDATIRKISDAAIMQTYGLNAEDLFFYEAIINETNQGGIVVYYKLCFFGYDTYEHYWVNLSADYTLEKITESDLGVFSCFLPNVTEQAIKNAEAVLDEALKEYEGVSEKFLSIDDNGNLCLNVEVIVDIVPPIADDEGNTVGCGLDHDHILITEIVCPKAE